MAEYDHKEIEEKWQKRWAESKLYEVSNSNSGKENFYTLVELPYPSGDLHVGHWYAFAVPDIFARLKRMQGYNSLYPIGFDAFGLPAENAAIKHGADPGEWTLKNIDRMRDQLKQMGNMFDWSREVSACDPAMYRWTQWLFLQLFKNKLATRELSLVNWCPKDQTVLANEQVIDGRCERCDSQVEKKELKQWFLKITDYADRLIDDLDELEWPESIKEAQRNWIGRSEGVEINFSITGSDKKITVFTTRPDTLFGATYIVLAPEHELIQELAPELKNRDEVEKYVNEAQKKSEIDRTAEGKEKTGVELQGIKAVNPASKEEIPIFVADYVLGHYGTGAIMAVPAHDERDFAFAGAHSLPIRQVVVPCSDDPNNPPQDTFTEVKRDTVIVHLRDKSTGKYALLNWHESLEGITTAIMGGIEPDQTPEEAALMEIQEEAAIKNVRIVKRAQFITAARYCASHKGENRRAHSYGLLAEVDNLDDQESISKEEANRHTLVWVDEVDVEDSLTPQHQKFVWRLLQKDQPLSDHGYLINSGTFDDKDSKEAQKMITEHVGGHVTKTYRQRDWLISRQRYWGTPIPIVYDPEGNPHAVPDEHLPWTLPTDVDFTPTGEAPLARSKELKERVENIFGEGWTPEVDTMDTFMDSSWYFLRYLDPNNEEEFCSKEIQEAWMPVDRYSGGAEHTTMHILYSRFFIKALFDLGLVTVQEPYQVRMNRSLILAEDGRKMSKRWGNVVNPDDHVQAVGADSVKMYLAFVGPYNEVSSYPWSTNGLIGVRKFLDRVWRLQEKVSKGASDAQFEILRNQTIKKVREEIESMKFNTGISALMIYTNELQKELDISRIDYEALVLLLAPFAPHMAEELWEKLGHSSSIHLEEWPEYDETKVVDDEVTISVQIGGKMRGTLDVARDSSQEEVEKLVRDSDKLAKYLDFKPSKVIFVPNRIINFVP